MLLPRVLTALIGIPFLLAAIYFGSLPFFFFFLGIVLLGLREFYYLAEESGYPCFSWIGVLLGGLLFFSVFLNGVSFGQLTDNQSTAGFIALILIVLVSRSLLRGATETLLSEWSVTFFGIFYVSWSLSHLLLLRDLRPYGQTITFMLFVMIWAADIFAYLVGKKWGRRHLAESISPKKTWEGTFAGVLASVIVALLFQVCALKTTLRISEAIFLGLLIGVLSLVSDLGESLIKRSAGVKDSSNLLPGHGGVLDRFDSFLLTSPIFYYYWAFVKH